MSLVKAANVQLGTGPSASNNFHWRNLLDGLLRLSRGNAGSPITDVMRVKADNSVEFPGGIASGRAWVDMTASRAAATTYTNTTVNDIEVQVTGNITLTAGGGMDVIVGGITIVNSLTYASGCRNTESFIVPAGSTYRVNMTNVTLNKWSELR